MAVLEPGEPTTMTMLYGMDTSVGEGIYKILYNFCTSKEMATKLAKKISSELSEKKQVIADEDDDGEPIIEYGSVNYCWGEEINSNRFLDSFEESVKKLAQGLEGNDIDKKLNKLFSAKNKEFLDNFIELVVIDSE